MDETQARPSPGPFAASLGYLRRAVRDPKHDNSKVTRPQSSDAPGVRFSLLYKGHRHELQRGTLVLGRGVGAHLVLDDALVSRKHAQIEVSGDVALVEDLGSVNGVFVNGERIESPTPLRDGDRIMIGQQEILIFAVRAESLLPESPTGRISADTLVGLEQAPVREDSDSESTQQGDALQLLAGVADKVLALGRGEEAERILGAYLRNFLDQARKGWTGSPAAAEVAASYAVKLAAATRKGAWVDYAIELFSILKRPLPGPVVDQLYNVLRQVSGVTLSLLRAYVATLRAAAPRFGPADRFLVQRIEGLERLASA